MKKSRFLPFLYFVIVLSISFYISSLMAGHGRSSSSDEDDEICGGIIKYPVTDEIRSLGRFSVDEHNKKENTLFEFVKVVKARSQVVAGVMFYITMEVMEAEEKKIYEARVWLQKWLNFKELTSFSPVTESLPITPSDKKGMMMSLRSVKSLTNLNQYQ